MIFGAVQGWGYSLVAMEIQLSEDAIDLACSTCELHTRRNTGLSPNSLNPESVLHGIQSITAKLSMAATAAAERISLLLTVNFADYKNFNSRTS